MDYAWTYSRLAKLLDKMRWKQEQEEVEEDNSVVYLVNSLEREMGNILKIDSTPFKKLNEII